MKKLLGILVLVLVACLACTAFADGEAAPVDEKEVIVTPGKAIAWGDLAYVTTINGHPVAEKGKWKTIKAPTCTEAGEAQFDCGVKEPELHVHVVQVLPLGHEWASEAGIRDWGNVIEDPTCDKTGKAQDVCLRCGETRDVYRIIDKTVHEYKDDVYDVFREPTCTAEGLGWHKCIYCGMKNPDEVDKDGNPVKKDKDGKIVKESEEGTYLMKVLPRKAHDFTEWRIIKESTCVAYGEADRACKICGMVQPLNDSDNEHKIPTTKKDKDGKEVDDGFLIDKVEGVAIKNPKFPKANEEHTFTTQVAYEKWLKDVKYEYAKPVKDYLDDCYTRVLTYKCPYCGNLPDKIKKEDGTEVPNPAKIHGVVTVKLTAPLTIAHEWEDKADETLSRKPECGVPGYNVYLCKYDFASETVKNSEGKVVGTHGHAKIATALKDFSAKIDAEQDAAKKAKMVADVLKLQGEVFGGKNDQQVKIELVDALEHDWTDWTVSRTYVDKDGKNWALKIRTCKICKGIDNAVEEILPEPGEKFCDEDDHEYELTETVEPTCVADGTKTYKCTICGFIKVDPVKATGHKADAEKDKVWKEATCTEAGMIEHTCEVCNEKYYEETAALGHDVVVDEAVAPTVEATGLTEGSHCARCNEVLVAQEELPKLLDGLVEMDDGEWHYYEEGEFIDDKTGIVEFEGGKFIVVNGVKSKAMGLTNCPGDVFYYLVEGQIQEVTQLAEYKGAWFAIKDGALDTSVNGLVDYDGGKFLFSDGWLRKDINGLCQVGDDWYFFANGQLQQVSQVASYDGEFFVIKDGKLDADYNGTIEYDGATFNVVAGQLYPIAE